MTDITNGATVHRVWGKEEEGTLVAHFQYMRDAVDFCGLPRPCEPESMLIAVDHYSGAIAVFREPDAKEATS